MEGSNIFHFDFSLVGLVVTEYGCDEVFVPGASGVSPLVVPDGGSVVIEGFYKEGGVRSGGFALIHMSSIFLGFLLASGEHML